MHHGNAKVGSCQPIHLSGSFIGRHKNGSDPRHFKDDRGGHFIVKRPTSTDRRRRLVSEWIANGLLARLGLPVPRMIEIVLPQHSQTRNEPQSSLGITFPCDPEKHTIFDLIPDGLSHKITNLKDHTGIGFADLWLANCRMRHSIFVRNNNADPTLVQNIPEPCSNQSGYLAIFVGSGDCFGGSNWTLNCEPGQNRELREHSFIYGFEALRREWIEKIARCSSDAIQEVFSSLPFSWVDQKERRELNHLESQLLSRAKNAEFWNTATPRKPVGIATIHINSRAEGAR
jgi:hypothetical protein